MFQHLLTIGVALTLAMSAACAPSIPQEAVARYGQAIEADDPEEAYALLSPELKARVDYDSFLKGWETRRSGLLPMARAFKSVETSPAQIRAEMAYSDYDTLQMRLTREGWRITSGVLDLYGQDTPRRALVAFVRAMEDRRYEALMRFIPAKYARHMSAETLEKDFAQRSDEIDELVTELKANLNNPIIHRTDRASMAYGHRKVTFILEEGAWKVEDPD